MAKLTKAQQARMDEERAAEVAEIAKLVLPTLTAALSKDLPNVEDPRDRESALRKLVKDAWDIGEAFLEYGERRTTEVNPQE